MSHFEAVSRSVACFLLAEASTAAQTPPASQSSEDQAAQLQAVDSRYFWPQEYDRYGRRSDVFNPFDLAQRGEYPIVSSSGWWDPYDTNTLKGDKPIAGENLFLAFTGVSNNVVEQRDVAGRVAGETALVAQQFVSGDLFYGDTVFRPPSWRLRATLAHDNRLADVSFNGETQNDDSLQELFGEVLLAEYDPYFDSMSLRAGRQAFNSDFRSFLFADVNDGVRWFGTAASNRVQYDLAVFDMNQKDKFSQLNRTRTDRDQNVAFADVFLQDAFWDGYTVEGSVGYVVDTFGAEDESLYYLGCFGDGHIGGIEVSHALVEMLGDQDSNPVTGRSVDVNAQLAALEVAVPSDWLKYVFSTLYASGDGSPNDGRGGGFDAVFDNPQFAGANFGFWQRQNFVIDGVQLNNANSLYPNLRNKAFNAPNSVNPGLFLLHTGVESQLSNVWSVFANTSYLWFVDSSSLDVAFNRNVNHNLGWDLSVAAQYRPLGIDNLILVGGVSALLPGEGLTDITGSGSTLLASFIAATFVF